jgi:polyisoprenyl-phosphate glycosyltransferase
LITHLMNIPSPRGWASTLAVILFVGGIQLLVLGVIGEYLGRVYDEVRQRPLYIISSRVGFANTDRTAGSESLTDRSAARR